jgi:Zonular occludens toxin (Zot)
MLPHIFGGWVPIASAAVAGVVFLVWLWATWRGGVGARGGTPTGGLNYVVGPMGAGKSLFGVRRMVEALVAGQYVVSNVRLLDGWAERVAAHEFPRDRGARRAARARWLEGFYIFERDLRQAMRYRLPCVVCGGDVRECRHPQAGGEGRAVVVWDETHNDLNNRDYLGHGTDKAQRDFERESRRLVLRWATQLRKLGYTGYLLSQHHENTDAQLRRVCNHLIRLQNQRTAGSKLGALLPKRFALFLAYWFPAHLADSRQAKVEAVRFERYVLPWHRHLYDSWELFHGIDDGLDDEFAPIVLPAGGRSGTPRSGVPAAAVADPATSPLEERKPTAVNDGLSVTRRIQAASDGSG